MASPMTPRRKTVSSVVMGALLLVGCGGLLEEERDTAGTETPAQTSAPVAETTQRTTARPQERSTTTSAAASAERIPDVIGMDLESAQELLRWTYGCATSSYDATGEGRGQWWDSNWTVVEQSPRAGAPISGSCSVRMGVVK